MTGNEQRSAATPVVQERPPLIFKLAPMAIAAIDEVRMLLPNHDALLFEHRSTGRLLTLGCAGPAMPSNPSGQNPFDCSVALGSCGIIKIGEMKKQKAPWGALLPAGNG